MSAPAAVPVLQPASPLAAPITHLTVFTLALGLAVFLAVTGATLYFSWKYRHRGARSEPPQLFGNARDEVIWMVLAALLLTLLFALAWWTMNRADPHTGQDGRPDLIVTGHQWYWEASYPRGSNPEGQGVARTANEIHIPAGRRMLVQLQSADVIHDLWVPQLGRKLDAVPGQNGRLWLQADRPGRYLGACAEFCGAQHAWMRFTVIAEPEASYRAWLARQARPAAAATGPAAQGAALLVREGCGECHTVRGLGTHGTVGPDLTHFASRATFAGGALRRTPAQVRSWLQDPQRAKPGTRMPRYPLTQEQLTQLTTYLETLK
ncbi:cytochrome c oxidase subunit II [Deinococcus aquiradiocola]|uniref:cytochrome-c oxidase n=1 Tax=Deinococcus aquiradiocola TaxID=393059 RepID=A0A917PGA1_9DEIO|nr:cytochrome c oxidase subunit II [Deinococcus aquiradiocola]GGJ75877.1 cytochrome c oxidase polypeptide II [Deinococcus aquiradiocola]